MSAWRGLDGLALLREIRSRWPEVVVVLMTAYATVAQAVEAMRAGAYDYLVKPFSVEEVGLTLDRILEVLSLRRENRVLRSVLDRPVLLESRNAKMKRVIETARQAAASDATLLLTGESGTGKGVLARAVHDWSARASGPFVAIACTTLSEHLLESELFGHVKGAFTGAWKDKSGRLEAAAGGTVFLDEIGELSAALQAKLLRFLDERRFERVGGATTIEIDARIVAATNRDLEAEVRRAAFREDLFYRLNVLRIELPALRERLEDLPGAGAPHSGHARRALRRARCSNWIQKRRRCSPATAGPATCASSSTCSSTPWSSAAAIACASTTCPIACTRPRRAKRRSPAPTTEAFPWNKSNDATSSECSRIRRRSRRRRRVWASARPPSGASASVTASTRLPFRSPST